MNTIIKKLFATSNVLSILLKMLPADIGSQLVSMVVDKLKELADAVIDKAEDYIAESETELDDTYLLPAIAALREAFNIPDED